MTIDRRTRAARIRLVAVATTAGVLAVPVALGTVGRADAEPSRVAQETPVTRGDDVQQGELAVEVDVFRAEQSEVSDTLDSLTDNVVEQLAELERAQEAVAEAEAEVDEAQAVVAATDERIDQLVERADRVAVDAFVMAPAETGLGVLGADSLADATVMHSILDREATASADVLDELEAAREEVETQRAVEEEAVGGAEDRASDAESQLADLEAAQSQQALFVAQVVQRLDSRLAEADALEDMAPEVAEDIREREAALAGQIEEIRDTAELQEALAALELAQAQAEAEAEAEAERLAAEAEAAAPGDIGAPSGSLGTVDCPSGGAITVDSALAPNLEAMLAAASSAGLALCGGGYRSPDEQVQLRRQNCGTSNYQIYEMPSSQCSPPTARPGSSQHEVGLAIDFTCSGSLITSSGNACFQWLQSHAADYGLYNLPSERWHWSTTGQ